MTAGQEQALAAWLSQSQRHQQAYAEAQQLWQGLGELQNRPIIAAQRVKLTADGINRTDAAIGHAKIPNYRKHKFALRQPLLIAACLALAAVLYPSISRYLKIWNADFQTAIGAQQIATLTDGSSVYLNAASAFNQNFSQEQRRIELLAGEAEFMVSKDSSRHFYSAGR